MYLLQNLFMNNMYYLVLVSTYIKFTSMNIILFSIKIVLISMINISFYFFSRFYIPTLNNVYFYVSSFNNSAVKY